MKRMILMILLLICPLSAFGLTVAEVVMTTQVVDRAPIDSIEVYPAQTGKLYCFTRIEGGTADSSVDHVWLYAGREMARVTLPVRSSKWRTYSSKKIVPEWKGAWEVRIEDPAGVELSSVTFQVE